MQTKFGSKAHIPIFALPTTKKLKGSIAQLVQSICLTSRGSAVRIRVLPQRSKSFYGLDLFKQN